MNILNVTFIGAPINLNLLKFPKWKLYRAQIGLDVFPEKSNLIENILQPTIAVKYAIYHNLIFKWKITFAFIRGFDRWIKYAFIYEANLFMSFERASVIWITQLEQHFP